MREAGRTRAGSGTSRLGPQDFARLFEQSWRTLWCIGAAVLGRRDEVDDVLQEAAAIALGKLEEFDPQTSFTAWMGQIVRYTALNTGRRRSRRQATMINSNGVIDQVASATHTRVESSRGMSPRGVIRADQPHFDDRLLNALNQLAETPRACLLLRVVEELSYRDIARALSIPEGTAMSHVHRAQRTLRELLFEADSNRGASD